MQIAYNIIKTETLEELEKLLQVKDPKYPYLVWSIVWFGDGGEFSKRYHESLIVDITNCNKELIAEGKKQPNTPKASPVLQVFFVDISKTKKLPLNIIGIPMWAFISFNPEIKPSQEFPFKSAVFSMLGIGYKPFSDILDAYFGFLEELKKEHILYEHTTEITKQNLPSVFQQHQQTLLYFWNKQCGICSQQEEILIMNSEILFSCFTKLHIGKVNTDDNPELCSLYKIENVPTWILYDHDKSVFMHSGGLDMISLYNMISQHITPDQKLEIKKETEEQKALI